MIALTPPAQPSTIEEAKSYLAWIRAEDYARQIREIKKQLETLKKVAPRSRRKKTSSRTSC